jgi:hypothetical protein
MSPRLLRPRSAGGFDPRRLTGLVAWWDGTDSSTINLDNNGGVELWRDKSGLSRTAAQTTANNRPTLGTLAGKQAVAFDATDDFLTLNTSPNSGEETLFIVFNGLPGRQIFGSTRLYFNASGNLIENPYAGFTAGTNRLQLSTTAGASRYIYGSRIGPTGATAASTTTAASMANSATATSTATGRIQFFSIMSLSSSALGGAIGEVLIYNRAMSDAEFYAVEAYLLRKWPV